MCIVEDGFIFHPHSHQPWKPQETPIWLERAASRAGTLISTAGAHAVSNGGFIGKRQYFGLAPLPRRRRRSG